MTSTKQSLKTDSKKPFHGLIPRSCFQEASKVIEARVNNPLYVEASDDLN
jgi:hypothetical protein